MSAIKAWTSWFIYVDTSITPTWANHKTRLARSKGHATGSSSSPTCPSTSLAARGRRETKRLLWRGVDDGDSVTCSISILGFDAEFIDFDLLKSRIAAKGKCVKVCGTHWVEICCSRR